MSEEVKDTNNTEEIQHEMYVQQVDWETFKNIIERVTNVNRIYMYNMPNKAEKYKEDIVGLIKTLDEYLSGDEEWRVTDEKNAPFKLDKKSDKIYAGNWVLGRPHVILCIPRLNSFFIIPDSDARYKESSAPTTIIQLSNCISVMPMILSMNEVPDKEKEGVINIAMAYQILPQNEEATE